jgi:hypothetical protein
VIQFVFNFEVANTHIRSETLEVRLEVSANIFQLFLNDLRWLELQKTLCLKRLRINLQLTNDSSIRSGAPGVLVQDVGNSFSYTD